MYFSARENSLKLLKGMAAFSFLLKKLTRYRGQEWCIDTQNLTKLGEKEGVALKTKVAILDSGIFIMILNHFSK
jgi:hypothetical protein